jgi:hypothetical protein
MFISIIGFSDNVYAVNNSYVHTKKGVVPWAKQNYGSNLYYHYFDGSIKAYCLQWSYSTSPNVTYNIYSDTSQLTDYNRYVAAKAIELINNDSNLSDDQKYTYSTWVTNCVFKTYGSSCRSSWKGYQTYVEQATKAVSEMQLCTGSNTNGCFNSGAFNFKIDGSNYTFNKLGFGNTFISNKITLTGMLASYGGTGTEYNISISSCPGDSCSICTDQWGNNCVNSKNITNSGDDYSFYVKVNNGQASKPVKIKATGKNSATYPYTYVYYYSSNTQKLAITEDYTVSRDVSKSLSLSVPAEHTVTATKVDENGEDLTGAQFEIYRTNDSGTKETLAKSDGKSSVSYTEINDVNNWSNYSYCFVETESPSGYVLSESDQKPFCIKPKAGVSSSTCYKKDGDSRTEVDSVNCDDYKYYCSGDGSELDVDVCRSNKEATTSDATTCSNGYTYNEEDKMCYKDESGDSTSSVTSEVTSSAINPVSPTSETTSDTSDENSGSIENPTKESASPICESGELVNGTCYKCDDGDVFDSDKNVCVHTEDAKCKNSSGTDVDVSYCKNRSNFEVVNITSSGNISFVRTNKKNSVSISKQTITGDTELYGAKMKVCTDKPNEKSECTVATLANSNEKIEWVSGNTPRTWRGLETNKTYYLVETVAPLGYAVTQYTTFSISNDGTVTSGDTVVEDKTIVVKNDLNKVSISKQDITTSEELPGAKLKICLMAEDENGEYQLIKPEDSTNAQDCVVAVLNTGETAEWTSSTTPFEITGLTAGTYALIEEIAPNGYDSAEKIIFTVNQDGTVSDKDGNLITDNKIVMKDKKIEQVPTGDILIGVVIILGIVGIGYGSYYFFKIYKKSDNKKETNKSDKKVK